MKISVTVSGALFDGADHLARRLGISLNELFQRAVEAYLEQHKYDGITEFLNDVYGNDPLDSLLDSALEYLQGSSILEADW